MKTPICLLVDNGSLRPGAVLSLRKIAKQLGSECSYDVIPMGLLHSNKIDKSMLNGKSGETIGTFLSSEKAQDQSNLLILPFFLGPSLGVTDFLVEKLNIWKNEKSGRSFHVLTCLHSYNDMKLAVALSNETIRVIEDEGLDCPHLALVDHGTPIIKVNQVREDVGKSLEEMMGAKVSDFTTCSMERREGDEYKFNEPLLESVLDEWGNAGVKEIVVSLLFLLSGRHAGKGGDIENIFEKAKCKFPGMKIASTRPLGENSIIYKILKDKLVKFGCST
jgi:hypothetical protein